MMQNIHCRLIFNNLPGSYLIIKPDAPDFTIVDFNKAGAKTTMTDGSVIGKKLLEVFTDNINNAEATGATSLKNSLLTVIETKKLHRMALQRYDLLNPQTHQFEERHLILVNIPVLNENQDLIYIIHAVEDVTEKTILQEKELKAQQDIQHLHEEQFKILESIADAFISTDRNWMVTYWNKRAETIFKIKRDVIVGKYLWNFIKEENGKRIQECFHKALQENKPVHFEEYYNPQNSWLQINAYPSGEGLTAFLVNITEQKKAKENYQIQLEQEVEQRTKELKESKKLLQSVFENTSSSIMLLQPIRNKENKIIDFKYLLTNTQTLKSVGRKSLKGKRILKEFPQVTSIDLYRRYINVVESREDWNDEVHININGFNIWSQVYATCVNNQLLVTYVDITERKKAEQQLKESKAFIEKITTTIPDLITIHDLTTKKVVYTNNESYWNDYFNTDGIYNKSDEQRAAEIISAAYQELAKLFLQERKLLTADAVKEVELKLVNDRWIKIRSKVFKRDQKGIASQLISVTTDITQQKKAEQEFILVKEQLAQKATDKYHALFNSIDEGFTILELIYDKNDKLIDYIHVESNPAQEHITGLPNLTGKRMSEAIPVMPYERKEWIETLDKVAKTGETIRQEYNSVINRWLDLYVCRVGGKGSRMVAVVYNDITDRKRAEERQSYLLKLSDAIREFSEPEEIQHTAAKALAGQLQVDRAFYTEVVNENEEYYYKVDRVYQAPGFSFPSGRYPVGTFGKWMIENRTGQNIVVTDLETETRLSEEERSLWRSFKLRSWVGVPLIKNGHYVAVFAVYSSKPREWTTDEIKMVEETAERTWNAVERARLQKKLDEERQTKQKEITEAVLTAQENERAELGKELHDNINQILTTTRMYIEHALTRQDKQAELLQYSLEHITKAIKEIRQLSHQLMPPSLDYLSLKQSLEELFLNLRALPNCKIKFDFLLQNEELITDALKLAIFRIVQEQLNNILRHAKATQIMIRIELKNPWLEVKIKDNGIGFDPQKNIQGIGLRNINSRAHLFDGQVKMVSKVDKGMELQIRFPIL